MNVAISVVLCTHNPHAGRLRRTLDALFAQKLSPRKWELVVVDNASIPPLGAEELSFVARPHPQLVREDTLGLIHARAAGIEASSGELIVFCDDDNVLAPDFLDQAIQIFSADPRLGNASGKSIPEFEVTPSSWCVEFAGCLALRDFGEQRRVSEGWTGAYPDFAFGGGGAV